MTGLLRKLFAVVTALMPILNLICLFAEILDPSTAFIRASNDESLNRPALIVLAKQSTQPDPGFIAVQATPDSDHEQMPALGDLFRSSESHAALVFLVQAAPVFTHCAPRTFSYQDLVNQFSPQPVLPPPIPVNALIA